jgi:hypothetical protein
MLISLESDHKTRRVFLGVRKHDLGYYKSIRRDTLVKIAQLLTITEATPISQLTEEQLKELQTALSHLGYPVGDIDGLFGPKTRSAWAEFKTDVFQGNPDLIGAESIATLREKLDKIGFSRELGESGVSSSLLVTICFPFYAACSTRALKRSKFARPYICRLIVFSRLTCPSTGPLLQGSSSAAATAAYS